MGLKVFEMICYALLHGTNPTLAYKTSKMSVRIVGVRTSYPSIINLERYCYSNLFGEKVQAERTHDSTNQN